MKSRIITALLIIGILLPIIYISPLAFKICAVIIVLLGTHELLEVKKDKQYSMITHILVYLINTVPMIIIPNFLETNVIVYGVILLLFFMLMIFDKNVDFVEMSYLFTFSLFIVISSNSAVFLRDLDNGFFVLVFIIITTAAGDTGAFFAGTFLGKHKLIERISPKKTIEGFIGGLALALIVGVTLNYITPVGLPSIWIAALVSLMLGLFAALGDLFFSSIKRTYQIKDFSNILPGHGGILDRVDSHLTNMIVYLVLILILGVI
ncbi:MAG: phosphatidate cytidylyltransferase [Erysipelotrichales bacterium]